MKGRKSIWNVHPNAQKRRHGANPFPTPTKRLCSKEDVTERKLNQNWGGATYPPNTGISVAVVGRVDRLLAAWMKAYQGRFCRQDHGEGDPDAAHVPRDVSSPPIGLDCFVMQNQQDMHRSLRMVGYFKICWDCCHHDCIERKCRFRNESWWLYQKYFKEI